MSRERQTTDCIVHELHCKRSQAPLWTSCDSMRILPHNKPLPNVTVCHRKHMEFASKFISVSFQQDIFPDPQALNQILPFPRQSSTNHFCSLSKGQFLPSLLVLAKLLVSISCTTPMCELCHDITVIPMRYCSSATAFRPLIPLIDSPCCMHSCTSMPDKAPGWADIPEKDMKAFSMMSCRWHSLIAVYSLKLTSFTLLIAPHPTPLPYLMVGRHLLPCCFVIPNLQLSLPCLPVV